MLPILWSFSGCFYLERHVLTNAQHNTRPIQISSDFKGFACLDPDYITQHARIGEPQRSA